MESTKEASSDSSDSAHADFTTQNIEIESQDTDDLPRDETEVIVSDEETEENENSSTDQNFMIEHINRTLVKCRKLINVTNKSNILYEIAKNLAQPAIKMDLVIDMVVRWNSTYKMLSHLLSYKPILPTLIKEISSNKSIPVKKRKLLISLQPTDAEWEILNMLSECLSRFADATEMLSGSSYPSFALTYAVLKSLQHYLNRQSDSQMENVIKTALKEKLEFYMEYLNNPEEHKLLLVSFKTLYEWLILTSFPSYW